MTNPILDFKTRINIENLLDRLQLDYTVRNEDAVLLCVFHDEQTPSLHLNLEQGMFNCFGCNTSGGDIISFIQKHKDLSFVQSVEFIANLLDIELPKNIEEIDKLELTKRKLRTLSETYISELVQKTYSHIYKRLIELCNTEMAAEYLEERNIQNIKPSWNIRVLEKYDLVAKTLQQEFSITELIASGIVNERQNLIFYNHRLLFPFYQDNEVVYISARTNSDEIKPKYLNLSSIRIPCFYNVDDVKTDRPIFFAEGLTDTLTLMGLGYPAVGLAGATNVDIEQLELFRDKAVILCFDNDEAGKKGQAKVKSLLQYVTPDVYMFPKESKDMNEYLSTEENRTQLKKYYTSLVGSLRCKLIL